MTRANSSTDFGDAKRITLSGVSNSSRAIKPSLDTIYTEIYTANRYLFGSLQV